MGLFDDIKLGSASDGSARPMSGAFADTVTKLCDQAGLKTQRPDDNVVIARFRVNDGRTQTLLFMNSGELAGKPIVKITSPVANLTQHPINGDAAIALLKKAGSVKIGSFSIQGDLLMVHQGMILSELTPAELKDIAFTLAYFADDAEKGLTGGDRF
jgi:hypothetical protein